MSTIESAINPETTERAFFKITKQTSHFRAHRNTFVRFNVWLLCTEGCAHTWPNEGAVERSTQQRESQDLSDEAVSLHRKVPQNHPNAS